MQKKLLLKNLFIILTVEAFLISSSVAKSEQIEKPYCLTKAEEKQISELVQDYDVCKERLERLSAIGLREPKLETHHIAISMLTGIIIGMAIGDKLDGGGIKKIR